MYKTILGRKNRKENMKATILTLFLLLSLACYSPAQNDIKTESKKDSLKKTSVEEKRKELWNVFHQVRFEKFDKFQDIDLYAENNSLTRICFICDKGLFVFYWDKGEGHIEQMKPAKLIMYNRINRITFEEAKNKEGLGFFKLWYYETEELSIGSD
jgi:hypothetical protein